MDVTRTTQNFPLQTIFGAGYFPEQHGGGDSWLSSSERVDIDEAITSMMGGIFDEVMKSLRATLRIH